jgi:hypothetical protein
MLAICAERAKQALRLILVASALCFANHSFAEMITSFESGDLDGWTAGDLNGSMTTVNSNRSSDGVYSTESSFTVPAGWAGWGVHTLISTTTAQLGITSSTTEISLDAYVDWANPNGWGVYGNEVQLLLNYEGVWTNLSPSSGALTNGAFSTLTYNISGHAAAMTAPGIAYSEVAVLWFLGTWADNGMDNGTQTISIDNINGDNLATVPEPASALLVAWCAMVVCAGSRRQNN